jgi:hypothetical protein
MPQAPTSVHICPLVVINQPIKESYQQSTQLFTDANSGVCLCLQLRKSQLTRDSTMVLSDSSSQDPPDSSFSDSASNGGSAGKSSANPSNTLEETLYVNIKRGWEQVLRTSLTSTEDQALAEVTQLSVRDGSICGFMNTIFFTAAPFVIPPLRKRMDSDNGFSKRFPSTGYLNRIARTAPVIIPFWFLGMLTSPLIKATMCQVSLGVRLLNDQRFDRVRQGVKQVNESMVAEKATAIREGRKPPTRQEMMAERMGTQRSQGQIGAQLQSQQQDQADEPHDWKSLQSVSGTGSIPESPSSEFDSKILDGSIPSPAWDSGFDDDDDVDDASPVSQSQRKKEKSHQAMSWDEIRRRAAASNPTSTSASSAGESQSGYPRQPQELSKEDAQRNFEARMDRERQGKDFDGDGRGGQGRWT